MKKGIFAFFSMCMMLVLAACGSGPATGAAPQALSNAAAPAGEAKVLVAYFSRTGHTKALAETIAAKTHGSLYEIRPAEPYPEDYNETVARFRRERADNIYPALAGDLPDIAAYDVIFIGYPNWGSDMAPAAKSFLSRCDWHGKTVVPFSTHGGGGWGQSRDTLRQLAPGAQILEGYEMRGGTVDDPRVASWLQRIGL